MADLGSIAAVADQKQRCELYGEWIAARIEASEVAPLKELAAAMVAEHRGGAVEVQGQLADAVCGAAAAYAKEAATAVLSVTEEQASKFPAAVHTLLLLLSGVAETEGNIAGAAGYHAKACQVCLDTRTIEDREKTDTLLKAASLHIKGGKGAEASRFLQDCKIKVKTPFKPSQKLLYNQVNAMVLDHEGNYPLAARGHLQVAQDRAALQSQQITEAAQIESLLGAARCALLCPAGERRDEVLQALCKDDRLDTTPLSALVRKAEQGRLLREADVAGFQGEALLHHAKALGIAVAEHNLLACSSIYANISTQELAQLLLTDPKTAEKTAARMIADGRLTGTISQVTGTVTFTASKDDTGADTGVEVICQEVVDICQNIKASA